MKLVFLHTIRYPPFKNYAFVLAVFFSFSYKIMGIYYIYLLSYMSLTSFPFKR